MAELATIKKVKVRVSWLWLFLNETYCLSLQVRDSKGGLPAKVLWSENGILNGGKM
jgi:hypothetical protein